MRIPKHVINLFCMSVGVAGFLTTIPITTYATKTWVQEEEGYDIWPKKLRKLAAELDTEPWKLREKLLVVSASKMEELRKFGTIFQRMSLLSLPSERVTDDALGLLAYFPNLTYLKLSDCDSVTKDGFKYIANLEELTKLTLESCDNIRDLSILRKLTKLEILELWNCDCINFRYLPVKIKTLSLNRMDSLIDDDLQIISQTCTHLTTLDITGCSRITPRGLFYLCSLPQLKTVYLPHGEGVDWSVITRYVRDRTKREYVARL